MLEIQSRSPSGRNYVSQTRSLLKLNYIGLGSNIRRVNIGRKSPSNLHFMTEKRQEARDNVGSGKKERNEDKRKESTHKEETKKGR